MKFESQDRRIKQIIFLERKQLSKRHRRANAICEAHGLDPYMTCEETQPICFEMQVGYVVGCAIAIKKGRRTLLKLPSYRYRSAGICIPGSVADDRKVGIGHGNLAAMLLRRGD